MTYWRIVAVFGVTIGCQTPTAGTAARDTAVFVGGEATYDTVAIVGGVGESNPLFQYRPNPFPALVDETTVLHASRGRLVVADMISGAGWEVNSPRGATGPGEFDGRQPLPYSHLGVIHTFGSPQFYNAWNRAGELLASERYVPRLDINEHFRGMAGGHLVMVTVEAPQLSGGTETLRQGIRIVDRNGEVVAEFRDEIPDVVMVPTPGQLGTPPGFVRASPSVIVDARGETILVHVRGEGRVRTLDPRGNLIGDREFDFRVGQLLLDADGRVWARLAYGTAPQPYLVMDRHLADLFRTEPLSVSDASGNSVLGLQWGEMGTMALVLLRAQPR